MRATVDCMFKGCADCWSKHTGSRVIIVTVQRLISGNTDLIITGFWSGMASHVLLFGRLAKVAAKYLESSWACAGPATNENDVCPGKYFLCGLLPGWQQ